MRTYDSEFKRTVHQLTGLTGELLDIITGILYAIAFIGEIPGKDSLASYLGVGKRTIDNAIAEAIKKSAPDGDFSTPYRQWMGVDFPRPRPVAADFLYPLATELVNRGLYLETEDESFTRFIARSFLGELLMPQRIQTKSLFVGYNIVLEYLWQVVEAGVPDESIENFVKVRYERFNRAIAKVEDFCEVFYHCNQHLFESPDMHLITAYLAEHVLEARKIVFMNGSAQKAKERLDFLTERN